MPAKKSTIKYPKIVINAIGGGFSVVVDWPDLSKYTLEEVIMFAEHLASAAITITAGNAGTLAVIQQAIGQAAGFKDEIHFGKEVIQMINTYLIKFGYAVGKASPAPQQHNHNQDEALVDSEDVLEGDSND